MALRNRWRPASAVSGSRCEFELELELMLIELALQRQSNFVRIILLRPTQFFGVIMPTLLRILLLVSRT